MKQTLLGTIHILLISFVSWGIVNAQTFTLGWTGNEVLSHSTFMDTAIWTKNVSSLPLGDRCSLVPDGDTLQLNYTFGSGSRDKWAQAYIYLSSPISLSNVDLFGIDVFGGNSAGPVGVELKFEDGSHQAAISWDNLGKLNRWAERISVAKKQFSNATFNWASVKVISIAVYNRAADGYTASLTGNIRFRNLIASSMADWTRAASREFINPDDYTTIHENAVNALISRQKSTGLLTTWNEDGTSWLYGQGLALKALSLEGSWNAGVPSNAAATAAEKLALFLASHQEPEGYWPRAWKTQTGAITVLREADGTVWMGDFPWPITGLQSYYKKSGDTRVSIAIVKGLDFLTGLIGSDGQFMTKNPQTGTTYEVASCEAYAAAILSLQESGDTLHANKLLRYITSHGWDSQIRCWREATYSDRIVLFANTWMSYYLFQQGNVQDGLDALSLAGKVLYTHGNGELYGMDGIVPLAVWYEGTLSYIAAGGPGSGALFDALKNDIHSDGMVSHYNENLGGMGGIWAVDWHSLDGTSWLCFTTAGHSPFDVTEGDPYTLAIQHELHEDKLNAYMDTEGNLKIRSLSAKDKTGIVRIFSVEGKLLMENKIDLQGENLSVSTNNVIPENSMILVQLVVDNSSFSALISTQFVH